MRFRERLAVLITGRPPLPVGSAQDYRLRTKPSALACILQTRTPSNSGRAKQSGADVVRQDDNWDAEDRHPPHRRLPTVLTRHFCILTRGATRLSASAAMTSDLPQPRSGGMTGGAPRSRLTRSLNASMMRDAFWSCWSTSNV